MGERTMQRTNDAFRRYKRRERRDVANERRNDQPNGCKRTNCDTATTTIGVRHYWGWAWTCAVGAAVSFRIVGSGRVLIHLKASEL